MWIEILVTGITVKIFKTEILGVTQPIKKLAYVSLYIVSYLPV